MLSVSVGYDEKIGPTTKEDVGPMKVWTFLDKPGLPPGLVDRAGWGKRHTRVTGGSTREGDIALYLGKCKGRGGGPVRVLAVWRSVCEDTSTDTV